MPQRQGVLLFLVCALFAAFFLAFFAAFFCALFAALLLTFVAAGLNAVVAAFFVAAALFVGAALAVVLCTSGVGTNTLMVAFVVAVMLTSLGHCVGVVGWGVVVVASRHTKCKCSGDKSG